MRLAEIMTPNVVTAALDEALLKVAELMRDHRVGSVVICDPAGGPCAMITDRDVAVRGTAERHDLAAPVTELVSRPLVTGDPEMGLEEAAALMVRHHVRRLPVLDDGELVGIVTLDDIAVRTGNLEVAQRMTREVVEGAIPGFYFHERG